MSVILALPRLFDAVVASMDADAASADPPMTPVPQAFGWREPARRGGLSMRIVWVPGVDGSGDIGTIGGARFPGQNPRSLATLIELFTVYIEAQDPTDQEDERLQYQVTRELFDSWFRAVHKAAHGTFVVKSLGWVGPKLERRFGAAMRVVCSIEAKLPDAPFASAPVDVSALIDVHELDRTEQLSTEES